MKKIIITLLVLGFCFVGVSAFAASGDEVDLTSGNVCADAEAGGTLRATSIATADIAKLSTNVIVGATYSDTGYAIDTYHLSGTKAYGTSYDSTAIYWTDLGTNGTLEAPASSDAAEAFTDWNKM